MDVPKLPVPKFPETSVPKFPLHNFGRQRLPEMREDSVEGQSPHPDDELPSFCLHGMWWLGSAGTAVNDRWGDATLCLRTSGVITKQHEAFVTSLYTLISDESVHPLGTGPEYARLLRNVVIEYGVMFLSVLDKRGIRITP